MYIVQSDGLKGLRNKRTWICSRSEMEVKVQITVWFSRP